MNYVRGLGTRLARLTLWSAVLLTVSWASKDFGPPEPTEFLSDAANLARNVLKRNEDMLPPTPSLSPTNAPESDNTLKIVLATVIVFLFLFIACHVIGILVICEYRKRKKKASQTFSGGEKIVTAGFESDIQHENAANIIDTSANNIPHRYEELQFSEGDKPANTLESGTEPRYEMFMYNEEGMSELIEHHADHRQPGRLSSKYGISATYHDFTDYNRQRSENTDWEYPRCNLIYMRELGEGQFGKVLLMKAKGIAGYEGKIPVAVKTLTSTDHEVVRKFMEEVELMKQFTHPNIVSLLGVGSKDDDEDSAPLLILEYMPYGDLQEFLESYRPQDGEESQITETHFYSFATDVARALEFLASCKYVHRDVAARNCLVGSGLQIKIADFGLARGVYDKDYYRVAGRTVLPVRWMAPECLLYGIFTTASDVWAYGVLLWEMVVYGELPLEDLEPQEIVAQAQNGTLQHPRPQNCPDVIYDLMCLCHDHDRDQRPSFTEILTTLEAINAEPDIATESDEPSSPV